MQEEDEELLEVQVLLLCMVASPVRLRPLCLSPNLSGIRASRLGLELDRRLLPCQVLPTATVLTPVLVPVLVSVPALSSPVAPRETWTERGWGQSAGEVLWSAVRNSRRVQRQQQYRC